jgi:hypothetical protein
VSALGEWNNSSVEGSGQVKKAQAGDMLAGGGTDEMIIERRRVVSVEWNLVYADWKMLKSEFPDR